MIEKELYIVRHGQTDLNAQGIVQGRGMDMPLNELGRQQAAAFFEAYRKVKFDAVYTSTLLRAIQTADRFTQRGIPRFADADLDEISWGEAEGKRGFTDDSDLFRKLTNEWKSGNVFCKLPGGESPFDMQQRQQRIIEKLKSSEYRTILVATHGRYIRAFMCTLTGLPLSNMDTFEHANLCLYKVNLLSNGHFVIEQHNNQEHLKELVRV